MSTTFGYARVSTTDQDLSIQLAALKAAGCTTIRKGKRSATSMQGRQELKTLLEFIPRWAGQSKSRALTTGGGPI
jgi:DNA invertase Pin-like site-specific DNA recombinase